jgi:hypothetical protein
VLAFHRGMWRFYSRHVAGARSPAVTLTVRLGLVLKLAAAITRSGVAAGAAVGGRRR